MIKRSTVLLSLLILSLCSGGAAHAAAPPLKQPVSQTKPAVQPVHIYETAVL
ncbi:hypothetical protein [Paenibacillus camerounensis]|uniref:hypothetical protein n=1 Tax=Paenibacillus camerounensis TaxID=1243663 RepID=UPI000A95DBD6|nr:hypothetical protein [Paenibacillus camerounensis]